MKRLTVLLISIILILSGCSGSADSGQNSSPPPDFQPLNEIVDGRKNIYLIVKNLDSSYRDVMIQEIQNMAYTESLTDDAEIWLMEAASDNIIRCAQVRT